MSWKSGSQGGRSPRVGWKKGGTPRGEPLHRWQDAKASEASAIRRRPHRRRWIVSSLLALGLIAFFVYLLLLQPTRTPVLIIAATDYAPPVPLNPWALEDRDALRSLHRNNLQVIDVSSQWTKGRAARSQFLPESLNFKWSRDREPLIILISMHGIVNEAGEPCLLPPGASLADPKNTWIRVEDVLKEIGAAVPALRNALVVLDCNRVRVDWNLGILYNTYADRLQQLVEQKKGEFPNLAVLTSASPGEQSWAAADLRGSAFGRYLQLGLAGAADDETNGNEDGKVSLHELAAYLQREVVAWSKFNRGEPQTPLLLPDAVADFRLTWTVGRSTQDDLAATLAGQVATPPAYSPEEIGALWRKLTELRKHELVRYDPAACRDLEHQLLRLEELSHGGQAYADQAKLLYQDLSNVLSSSVSLAQSAANSRALADHLGILSPAKWAVVPAAAHTLPASEYFGACDANQSKQVESLWAKLTDPGSQQDALSVVAGSDGREFAERLAETEFLVSARQQQVATLWPRQPADARKLLTLRNNAEQLAVPRTVAGIPGDERAHYYARGWADQADAQRRLAEDILFVGELNAPQHVDAPAAAAADLYTTTRQVMDEASAAWHVYDIAAAETPYLSKWLCSPMAVVIPEREQLFTELLIPTIRGTRELGDRINRLDILRASTPPTTGSGLSFRELAQQVQVGFDELKVKFRTEYRRLSKGDAQGPPGFRAIEATLMAPWIPGTTRGKLLENRAKVSAGLHKQYFGARESDAPPNNNSPPAYLDVLGGWQAQPLLEILQVSTRPAELAAGSTDRQQRFRWCETSAAAVRARLLEPPVERPDAVGLDQGEDDRILRERHRLSLAERTFRVAAALDFKPVLPSADPITSLRRFDLQQLLIWQAQRAMEDFWGNVTAVAEEAPFFAVAAADFLSAAENVGGQGAFSTLEQLKSSRSLLNERLQAKRDALPIVAAPRLLVDPPGAVAIALKVTATSQARNYPSGCAALFIRGKTRRLTDLVIERPTSNDKSFVEFPLQRDANADFQTVVTDTSDIDSLLTAAAFFRGRVYSSGEFPLPILKGVVIDYEPYQYRSQRITLFGDRLQRSSIALILDCSYSMDAKTVVALGNEETRSRMAIATGHLNTMLNELADRNRNGEGTRVGVRFFGHRAVWTRSQPPQVQLQPGYAGNIPKDLAPSQDVEVIHSLGRFDDTAAGQIRVKLNSVKSWGQTPLYLALTQALVDFDNEDPNTRKSIVAITDGENDQWEPASVRGRLPYMTLQNLLDAWERRSVPIPIHILTFDIPAVGSESVQLARHTGGTLAEVTSGNDLLTKLRERLDLDGYLVRDSQAQPINLVSDGSPVPAKLNTPVVITAANRLPQAFSVDFRGLTKQVELEGGEAIELVASENGSVLDIGARPFGRSVAAKATLVSGAGGRPSNHIVRAHRPRRQGHAVRFPVSLQLDPRVSHFTARPAETWVEITPLANRIPAGEPFVFYDRNLEPDTPVPVLAWTAGDWPAEADRARIRYWCKDRPTDPVQEISLGDVRNAPARYREFQPVPGVAGVELSIDQMDDDGNFQINVVERHGAQSPGIDALRVHFETDRSIKPNRITHQFDTQNRIATHSFYFSPELRNRIEQLEVSRISIAKGADVKDGALQLASGSELEVPIDASGELFSPEATSQSQ